MDRSYLALCDFDHDIYGQYDDLKTMNHAQLEDHFLQYGIGEGRVYGNVQNRKEFLGTVNKNGKMLEIGPLDNPQLDHRSHHYYSVDVFNRQQLIRNYSNDPNVNKEKIIEPTFIVVNNDYSGIRERFQCIFSSHNIEHMPCLVTFLNNLEGLLNDTGLIYLIVPDKRFCFDHFKDETDIYDVLQAYQEKNSRPRFSDVLRNLTQVTHNNSVAHWGGDRGETDYEVKLTSKYANLLNEYNTGQYIDAHVSFFTPLGFIKIITLLNQLKLINLVIHRAYHTLRGGLEFYVVLKRGRV